MDWDAQADVVVVGGGGCGLMAAYVAARGGAEVVLLEKDSRLGCNTELASGSIAAAGTRYQVAAGITGTADEMAEDILRKNRGQANRDIVHLLCRRAGEVIDIFVDELGLPLTLNLDAGRFGQSFPRLHNPAGRTGVPLIAALRAKLAQLPNVTLADRTPGAGLVTDERGAVTGVLAGEGGATRIGANRTILATDGFASNGDMLRSHIPEMAGVPCIGAQGNTGDGIRWGMALGAALDHMSGYQGHGYVSPAHGTRLTPEMPLLGAIMLDMEGRRFTREDQGYSELARVLLAQPRGMALEIFDQRIFNVVAGNVHFQDSVAGALKKADTLEDLARAFGIDPVRARASVDAYYAGVATGRDPLGRETFGAALTPPYYGALITGAMAHTQGGLRVDVHARVLRADGTVIPNLYAGGGTAAGISGDGPDGYLSGNGLLSAFGLGLIAGEHAARSARGD